MEYPTGTQRDSVESAVSFDTKLFRTLVQYTITFLHNFCVKGCICIL